MSAVLHFLRLLELQAHCSRNICRIPPPKFTVPPVAIVIIPPRSLKFDIQAPCSSVTCSFVSFIVRHKGCHRIPNVIVNLSISLSVTRQTIYKYFRILISEEFVSKAHFSNRLRICRPKRLPDATFDGQMQGLI